MDCEIHKIKDGEWVRDRFEVREPKCGRDFCDKCGDCLHCYGSGPCYADDENPEHRWIIYEYQKLTD